MPSLRSGFCLCRVRFTAYLSLLVRFYAYRLGLLSVVYMPYDVLVGRCLAALWTLSFAVVFSVVGSLLAFPLLSRLFLLGAFLYCSCGCIPSGDALGIL